MEVVFLGTSSMQPTAERNLIGILISCESEKILVDCGEGIQRQMKVAKFPPTKITRILITHNHTDHTLGLGGLVRNLVANQYSKTLEIYGPKGIKDTYFHLVQALNKKLDIKVKIHEVSEGVVFKTSDLIVEAKKLDHTLPCFGYSIKETDRRKINLNYLKKFGLKQHPILGKLQKGEDIEWEGKKILAVKGTKLIRGKKISIVLDTKKCKNAVEIAKDANLLICESTFSNDEEKKAKEFKHLTSKHAAEIAKEAKVKALILTHFSQRYKIVSEIEKEAKIVFKKVKCSKDFMKVKI